MIFCTLKGTDANYKVCQWEGKRRSVHEKKIISSARCWIWMERLDVIVAMIIWLAAGSVL